MRAHWPLLAALLASCVDPIHDERVDALGPEVTGVRPGPTHRPGQPCTTCHGGAGPGSPEFVVAGTVFRTREGGAPAPGVDVVVTAADGRSITLLTNQVGNFYLPRREWDAPFPMHVTIAFGGVTRTMQTRIGGDGGCATCHSGAEDATHLPHVYVEGP